jgi:hypothetical protein
MSEIVEIFIITILAELVAGFLLIIAGGVLSKRARWILTATLGRLLDVDVDYVFRSKRESDEDVRDELGRASFVCLLTGRGNELQRDTFEAVLRLDSREGRTRFKILLPSTSPETQPNWTAQREGEIAAFDAAFGKGILANQIETSAKFLEPYVALGRVELKRFNYPHIGRILLTDRVVYFTPYRADAHGRDSQVIKYRRGGEMYDVFSRLFTQLWNYS